MGLMDALNTGASGILAHQGALQVVGNNIANAASEGYARQVPHLNPTGRTQVGLNAISGAGVRVDAVQRVISESLESRINDANSQKSHYEIAEQVLTRVESLFNEMTDTDVSTALTELFNSFALLAQNPQDMAQRGIVLQRASALSDRFNYIREGLENVRLSLTEQLEGDVADADRVAEEIAKLNVQIVSAESSGGTAASLRDQRDGLIRDLSELVGITTRPDESGAVNIFIGSEPLVYNGDNRGLKLTAFEIDGQIEHIVTFSDNDGAIELRGGSITGLQATRDGQLAEVIDRIDNLASEVIWQVNRLHTSGTGLEGVSEVRGTYQVLDATVALNNPETRLDFAPQHGSFLVTVSNVAAGSKTTHQINVNLTGGAGDTTLNDVLADLNAIPGLSASLDGTGKVTIATTNGNDRVSFGEDTSGLLASLGINTFFDGANASDISLNAVVENDAKRIAAGRSGETGDGQVALDIAALADSEIDSLNGLSLPEYHQRLVADVAVWTAGANDTAESATVVMDGLSAQRESISGVSMDEEAINLIRYQRAFQGSARFVTVVNELLDELMSLV